MYTYNYINQLNQLGLLTADLCISILGVEVYRTQKSFPENVTNEEMDAFAQQQIANFEASLANGNIVPEQVSPRQIRQALSRLGLRDAVEYAVSQSSQDIKDWWGYSTIFERHNSEVTLMAGFLGVSDIQLDYLWQLAYSL